MDALSCAVVVDALENAMDQSALDRVYIFWRTPVPGEGVCAEEAICVPNPGTAICSACCQQAPRGIHGQVDHWRLGCLQHQLELALGFCIVTECQL